MENDLQVTTKILTKRYNNELLLIIRSKIQNNFFNIRII